MLELIDITKRFGRTLANDHISLTVDAGEMVALLGENGAGKSTLLSIAGGFMGPDAGEIAIGGRWVSISSPRAALRLGVAVVHQHFALVPTFTVREQMMLAGSRQGGPADVLENAFSLESRIEDLALGHQQRVEIARALVTEPRVLLLDEPTSILAPGEIAELFTLLRRIRSGGAAIVLVTHKIEEAIELADRILVLRRGRLSAVEKRLDGAWREGARDRVLNAMFDWTPTDFPGPTAPPTRTMKRSQRVSTKGVLLSVNRLSTVGAAGRLALRDISFSLNVGQRMAVIGVNGQGQRELLEALSGYGPSSGEIHLPAGAGKDADRISGVGYVTDDRMGEGGATHLDLSQNLLLKRQRLSRFGRRGILNRRAIDKSADQEIRAWRIHPSDRTQLFGALSGGNAQKVLLAREFSRLPHVLLAANPVHGLDARTAAFLWSEMEAFTGSGGGVIFTTSELRDALLHADIVAVLFNGRLSAPLAVASATEHRLAEMMVSGR